MGKYFNIILKECINCHNNCLTCDGPNFNDCLTCNSNKLLLNKDCVDNCPSDYY